MAARGRNNPRQMNRMLLPGQLSAAEQLMMRSDGFGRNRKDLDAIARQRIDQLPPLTSEELMAAATTPKTIRASRRTAKPNQMVDPRTTGLSEDIKKRNQLGGSALNVEQMRALLPEDARKRVRAELNPEEVREAVKQTALERITEKPSEETVASEVNEPIDKGGEQAEFLQNIANVGKKEQNPEQTAASFMEEFEKTMPEYEGKTGFEKGMDLMKFGMAIAAGESPNAIANISKGFLAMGDTFTEDAKERRAYNRQIGLAKAQYGLERLNKLRDQRDLDKRNITPYRSKKEITLADGTKIPAGEVFNLNMDYIQKNGIPKGAVQYEYDLKERELLEAKEAAVNELLKDAKEANIMADAQITSRRDDFQKSIKDVSSNTKIVEGVDELRNELLEGNIGFGAKGIGQATKESIQKFFGTIPRKGLTRDEWMARTKLLIQKAIPVTLGEAQSANSISNKDVDRLIKAYFDGIGEDVGKFGFETAFQSPGTFFKVLTDLRGMATTNRKNALGMMSSIETELSDRTTPSGRKASVIIEPFRGSAGMAKDKEGIWNVVGEQLEQEKERQAQFEENLQNLPEPNSNINTQSDGGGYLRRLFRDEG